MAKAITTCAVRLMRNETATDLNDSMQSGETGERDGREEEEKRECLIELKDCFVACKAHNTIKPAEETGSLPDDMAACVKPVNTDQPTSLGQDIFTQRYSLL